MKKAYITDKTAFVVGNAPSLSTFDFDHLKSRKWVGMNAAYRHWENSGIYPTHYACLDEVLGLSHASSICKLVDESEIHGIEKFLLRQNLILSEPLLHNHEKVYAYENVFSELPDRVRNLVTTGSHAALWLASLGYMEIVLLGIDANYTETVETAKLTHGKKLEVFKSGLNPNYYFDGYQKPGDKFLPPNPIPGVHTGAWKRVVQHLSYASPHIKLLNGSPLSHVDSTEFIDIKAFFEKASTITSPKEIFSQTEHRKRRQAQVALSTTSKFSIAQFVDNLSSSRYNHYSGGDDQERLLSKFGWTRVKKSSLRTRWGLIFYSGLEYLNSPPHSENLISIIIINPISSVEADSAIKRLERDYDTILQVTVQPDKIFVTPSTSAQNLDTHSIVAFAWDRFEQHDLQSALKAAVSENYRAKFRLHRRLYFWSVLIKDFIKSIFGG